MSARMFSKFVSHSDIDLGYISDFLRKRLPVTMSLKGVNADFLNELYDSPSRSPLAMLRTKVTIRDILTLAETILDYPENDLGIIELGFTVPAGTQWGLFDCANGERGVMRCHTDRDWNIPLVELFTVNGALFDVDDENHCNYGYAPSEICGKAMPLRELKAYIP